MLFERTDLHAISNELFMLKNVLMIVAWRQLVSLLILLGPLYAAPFGQSCKLKLPKCLSEPNSRKYLFVKIATFTILIKPKLETECQYIPASKIMLMPRG